MNNQLLRAPLSSISEAPTESSNATVAICRHNLNASEGYTEGTQFCFIAFVSEKLEFYRESHVSDGEPAKSSSVVFFCLGVSLLGKQCKAVCILSRCLLD